MDKLENPTGDASPKADDKRADDKADKYLQADVGYTALRDVDDQGCAICRWYNWGDWADCQIVRDWPEPILATGWCEKFDKREVKDPMVLKQADPPVDPDSLPKSKVKGIIDTLIGLFKVKSPPDPVFTSFPTANGFKTLDDNRWIAWWTNTYEDSEDERFDRKAIDDYIARVDSGDVSPPELWFWHLGFTKHGKADTLARVGEFGVAVGHYDDVSHAKSFSRYYQQHEDLEVSHGYYYRPEDLVDGVYRAFNTFEISVLPRGKAANPFTSFKEVQAMTLTDEKKAELLAVLNQEELDGLIAAAEARGKEKGEQDVQAGYKTGLPDEQGEQAVPQPDDGLAGRLKALEDGAGAYATKADVQAIETGIKTLVEFLVNAFGTATPASIAGATQLPTAQEPAENSKDTAHQLMANFLEQQGADGGKGLAGQKSLFGHMFGPLGDKQGGE